MCAFITAASSPLTYSMQLRRGSNTSGILFCHADYVSEPDGQRRVAAENLADLLESGM